MKTTKSISWQELRRAEKEAESKNIHISKAIKPDCGEIRIVKRNDIKDLIKKRPYNSHKGSFGRLVIVAGSDRFPGAAQISTLAALRSGVGLIKVFSTKASCASLSVSAKEATLFPCPSDDNGFIKADENVLAELHTSCEKADAVLIGCGLGVTSDTQTLLKTVIESSNCPVIIDADGINLVSSCIELLRKAKRTPILTPHPAELSRLSGVSTDEALEQRYTIASKISDDHNAVVCAKSCATVVVSDKGSCVVCFGNDGLSKGGSGDMLAGLIASFAAQGIGCHDSCVLGSSIMGIAAEKVSAKLSKTGMLASDVLGYIPRLFKKSERA